MSRCIECGKPATYTHRSCDHVWCNACKVKLVKTEDYIDGCDLGYYDDKVEEYTPNVGYGFQSDDSMRRTVAFGMGHNAFYNEHNWNASSATLRDNPFKRGTYLYAEWRKGWLSARRYLREEMRSEPQEED